MGGVLSFEDAHRLSAEAKYETPPWAGSQYRPPQNLGEITQRAIDMYMVSKQDNGEMGGLGWGWQSANGYTAMALHEIWSRSNRNYSALADALKRCESNHHNLVNEFNDDTLWWAICCVETYTIAGDPWFLDRAKDIWHYMRRKQVVCGRGEVKFRDRDMEGACYWTTRDGEEAINSITTGLYAELCVRLALVEKYMPPRQHHGISQLFPSKKEGFDEYIEAARCSLGWILRCRYRVEDGIVLDSIMLKKDEEVDWTFTYTTGVALGVCALIYEALGQREYLDIAIHMANKAMRNGSWVEENGVLTEKGAFGRGTHDPLDNGDAVGFKAILMRHLAILYDVIVRTNADGDKVRETVELLRTFVNINFQSQQERNTNGNAQYGPWWNGPFEVPTSHSQMAALDVMAAVRAVNRY